MFHIILLFFLCQEAVNHFNIICPFMYVVAAFWNEQDCLLQLYFGDTWNYITFREYSNTVSNGINIASSKSQRNILAEDTPYSLLSTSLLSLWRRLYFFSPSNFFAVFSSIAQIYALGRLQARYIQHKIKNSVPMSTVVTHTICDKSCH